MSKKVVYLSGPITGMDENNYKAFAHCQEKIEAMGFQVLNPHEICQFIDPKLYETEEDFWQACMRECCSKLPYAHHIVTLEGWENSRGAKKEVAIARELGFIEVHHIITFLKAKNDTTDIG